MKEYQLQPTEVILYENENVHIQGRKGHSTLILTNLYIVLETTIKKLFRKSYTTTECFDINTVKTYNDTPQIKQKGFDVTVSLTNTELRFTFDAKGKAHKFTATALELLTGKNAFFRAIDKAKQTVSKVDNALGIDTIGVATTAVKTAVNIATPAGKFKKTKAVLKIANGAIQTKETKKITETPSQNNNLETLKQLKSLLDEGVITQDEFDIKKKELLNL